MFELTSNHDSDDGDKRFQPPLEATNKKRQLIDEGYRLASMEINAPLAAIPIPNDISLERRKRDTVVDNTSIPNTSSQSSLLISTESVPSGTSNNGTNNGSSINEADANIWADILSLSPTFDGSGVETESRSFFLNTCSFSIIE